MRSPYFADLNLIFLRSDQQTQDSRSDQQTDWHKRNLLRLERIITLILRIDTDYPWSQTRAQQEVVFIKILVQMILEQDLCIIKVQTISVYQDNYHSITESVDRIS